MGDVRIETINLRLLLECYYSLSYASRIVRFQFRLLVRFLDCQHRGLFMTIASNDISMWLRALNSTWENELLSRPWLSG